MQQIIYIINLKKMKGNTFKIIYNSKDLKYKIQKRLLWGLIWYDIEYPAEVDLQGFEYARDTIYFNSHNDAVDYIQENFVKGKDYTITVLKL